MAIEVILPRVDMDMATGQISRWYVDPGARVEKGQPLFEIETDKAAMEIEAPASGVLRQPASTGVQIPVGSPVAWIAEPGEEFPAREAVAERPEAALAGPVEPEAVAGDLQPSAPAKPADQAVALRATPLARRLARTFGIGLDGLVGSGPRGRIQARDVETLSEDRTAGSGPGGLQPTPVLAPAGRAVSVAALSSGDAGRAPETVAAPSAGLGPATGLHAAWLRQGEGDPIVLVHGFGADLDSWRPFVQGLQGQRGVLAVDLPGHGRSPDADAVDAEAIAAAVAEAIRARTDRPVHLVGHSLGAAIAALVADGGRVVARSLFLLAPAGLGPQIDGAFIAGFGQASEAPALAAWMRWLVADPAVVSDALVRATVRARARDDMGSRHAAVAAGVFAQGTQTVSIASALARLPVPIRAVVGTEDRIIPADHAARLPGAVAVHRLPGVGHMPQLEARDLVVRLLTDHIRSAG